MNKIFTGKVALVTGGSRGIGAATAHALAAEGADVAIGYGSSAGKAEAVIEKLKALGVRAAAFKADQGDPAQVEAMVKAVFDHFGRLDILVNNAGVATIGKIDDPGADVSALDQQYSVNIGGVVAGIRAAARLMGEGGRIISLGSNVATRVGFPGLADYSATKAAVTVYSKGAARDLAPRNITVNVVAPGPVATDMNPDSGDLAEKVKATVALGRYARPEEIAAGIVFLASPGASYITGAVLNID
ncbi:MAG: SDR family NAD(P)-dependent oxidoreductase, partial [Acidobacteriota bacterium]